MSHSRRTTLATFVVLFGFAVWTWQPLAQTPAAPPAAQSTVAPTNDAPNPYQTIEGWAKMPAGRDLGIDERRRHRQGRHVDLGRRALRREQLLGSGTARCRRSTSS